MNQDARYSGFIELEASLKGMVTTEEYPHIMKLLATFAAL